MDYIKTTEKMLDGYKTKKAKVDKVLDTIKKWEESIGHPEVIEYIVRTASKELGMPTAKYKITSCVENEVMAHEYDQEEAIEIVKTWISDEYSKIFLDRMEVDSIEIALSGLTKPQRFVIEQKYFEGKFWNNIEIEYNEKFREKNYVTFERLKQINKEALGKLSDILIRKTA